MCAFFSHGATVYPPSLRNYQFVGSLYGRCGHVANTRVLAHRHRENQTRPVEYQPEMSLNIRHAVLHGGQTVAHFRGRSRAWRG